MPFAYWLRTAAAAGNAILWLPRSFLAVNDVLAGPTLLVVDGMFGPKTRARTLKFQQQAKLVADGIVGPLTAKALMAASLVKLMGH